MSLRPYPINPFRPSLGERDGTIELSPCRLQELRGLLAIVILSVHGPAPTQKMKISHTFSGGHPERSPVGFVCYPERSPPRAEPRDPHFPASPASAPFCACSSTGEAFACLPGPCAFFGSVERLLRLRQICWATGFRVLLEVPGLLGLFDSKCETRNCPASSL